MSNDGWTPLTGRFFNNEQEDLGQTFTEDQLPDPEAQRAIGIDPEKYRRDMAHLIEPQVSLVGFEQVEPKTEV